jgi:hypothetical protein
MTIETKDPSTEQTLSIWFFVGVLMLSCGVLILGQGIYEFTKPPVVAVVGELPANVLAKYHGAFWWGLAMTLFGGFYTVAFRPGKG